MGFGSGFGVNFTASTRFSGGDGGGTDRLSGPYASYDTALAALRADAAASDGDVYQLTDERIYVAYVSEGPGVLLPPPLARRVLGYVDTSAGDAYFTLSDDEDTDGDLTARGLILSEAATATSSKVAGSPLELRAPASGDFCSLTATPSASQTKTLALMRVSALRAETDAASSVIDLFVGSGARRARVSLSLGGEGVVDFASASNAIESDQQGVSPVLSDGWLLVALDGTDNAQQASASLIDNDAVRTVEYADLTSSVDDTLYLQVQAFTPNLDTQLDVDELHWLRMS